MNDSIEVLSPAGSPETLLAAVRAGADAVYLGGSAFSARANAQNFDNEALKSAVEYCHMRGVKVYLAVNTLLLQNELQPALSFIQYACTLPVDALLVQDTGLLSLVQKCAPTMRLHASTQMSVHTPGGAAALYKSGLERVVLSRELSLEEIKEISSAALIELEVFVHGALCMSVSGQCYFSSVLGSRSGNRGLCAQPCRLPFSTQDGTGHDLSLKDLSMITRIDALADCGVASAKIEGRMKRPEYVAAATAACRKAADGESVPPELMENLSAVFSRSGFTTGYLDAQRGREMFGTRTKEDVVGATNAVFSELKGLYHEERQSVPIEFYIEIMRDEPLTLAVKDKDGHAATASGEVPQQAVNRAIDEERCAEQLHKTGGTPFVCEKIDYEIEDGLSVPISAINKLRREVLENLEQQRSQKPPVAFTMCEIPQSGTHRAKPMRLRARFANAQAVPQSAQQCELIFLPLSTGTEQLVKLSESGMQIALEIPRGMFGREKQIKAALKSASLVGIKDVWAGNLGAVAIAKETGMRVHGGFSLNITNTAALEWYSDFGLIDTELSFELTLAQADAIGGTIPRGLLLYGRLPLMLCRNCPAANSAQGCRNCRTAPNLTDRRGINFPIQCVGGCSEILNSVPLAFSDRLNEVKNQDFGVLHFTVENSVESEEILRSYLTASKPVGDYTRGLYYRGVE